MSAEAIRTWTLRPCTLLERAAIADEPDPVLLGEDRPEVIELEPVLDLLERMIGALKLKADPGRGASPTVELTLLRHDVLVATDLLRKHGRLA